MKSTNFFCAIVDQLLKARENEISHRNDFMAIMTHALKQNIKNENSDNTETDKGLDREDIIASGVTFFMAGIETVSNGISVCCYHLSQNQDWQSKVIDEITSILDAHDNVVSNSVLNELTLLEMCIEECLRLSPPGPVTDRVATEDVNLDGITIQKGMHIWIPIYAIHHHPDYYPDPEKYDPMRFTPEAKAERSKFTNLAFGIGPRECIAKRLAMMEVKTVMVHLLRSFKLLPALGDKSSMKYGAFGQLSECWVRMEKRNIEE